MSFYPSYTQPLPVLSRLSYILLGFSGLLSITCDGVLLAAFIKFMYSTKVRLEDNVDLHFMIVAKHGIIAIGFAFLSLVFFGLGVIIGLDAFSLEVTWNVSYLFLVLVLVVLIGMKIGIRQMKLKQKAVNSAKKGVSSTPPRILAA
ncbi:hypothetical protein HDU83_005489 [Entophlyctis luteolus]|nr:hypothetical protein HDU83_005489 [Entophlyctis luteolus]KAJ3391498.1 hypothetical protein HDU84_005873 [Entophlyctis sp. JEL0112]